MNRRIFFLSLTGLAGCTGRSRPRLNVYNWSDYIAPDTIAGFEREFGVRIRYATYEANEELLAKVWSGNSGWDVVFPSTYFVPTMCEQRLLAPLRHDWLPNLGNLDPMYQSPAWDRKLEWCVPYLHGATGIVYNSAAVRNGPDSWAAFWEDRYHRRATMLDDPTEVIGAALLKLGYPLNSGDPVQLQQARSEAIAIKPHLRAYINAEVRDQLIAGDVIAAQIWTNTAQSAINSNPALRFVYPAEGFALYADCAVMLRESSRTRLAHEFQNYLLRPEISAAIALSCGTATANGAATRLLPEPVRRNPTLYPDLDTLSRGQWFETLTPAVQRLRDRLWTEIKSA
jgi:spermidine/putrescine transport system substrate-binding protein